MLLDSMEHKTHVVSIVLFVTFLCTIDFMSGAIEDRSSSLKRRRFIEEQGVLKDGCADIIGATRNMNKEEDRSCPILTVWVPKKVGFTEYVNVNEHTGAIGGFSIEIFCHALRLLPYNVHPNFKVYQNDHYGELVEFISGKNCTAMAGDVTIRYNRTQYVDFTAPYLSSEVYMLVLAAHEWNQTLWTFFRPFTWRLWITIIGACIFTGVALSILEYRAQNPRFSVPFYQQLIMVFWFPISTFFFNEGRIRNKCSKVVLVLWLSMIFIIIQIFTATLSSWLTLDQLRPRMPSSNGNTGYQSGSFLDKFIMEQNNCSSKNLVPLKTIEEYKNALSSGSVNSIYDELPYVDLFLAKYGSDYMKIGPIKQESGIAFAFPIGSPLLRDFSRAVINVTESETMLAMKKKYLEFSTPNTSQPNQAHPQSLDVQSFIALFVFMGIVTIATIIWSEISLRCVNKKIHPLISTDKEQVSNMQHTSAVNMGSFDVLKHEDGEQEVKEYVVGN